MSESFTIGLPSVRIECKDEFETRYRKGCPLKDYLESDESVYVAWPQDKRLLPNTTDLEEAYQDITQIRQVCEKCKNQSKTR